MNIDIEVLFCIIEIENYDSTSISNINNRGVQMIMSRNTLFEDTLFR